MQKSLIVRTFFLVIISLVVLLVMVVSRRDSVQANLPEINLDQSHPLIASAIQEAMQDVEFNPQAGEVWGKLGMILLAHGLIESAQECLQQAAELAPNDYKWPYLIGYSWEDIDYDNALKHYEKALGLRPDYISTYLRIATILMRLGALDRCEEILGQGLSKQSDNPYLIVTLARLKITQQKYPEAEQLLQTACQITDWMPHQSYLELVKLSVRSGDIQRAYELQQKLNQFPDVAQLEYPDPVLQGIRQYEGLAKSLAERADFALARGDAATAIHHYEEFLTRRSDFPNVYSNLARAYTLAGRFEDASRTYQTVIDKFGDNLNAYLGQAGLYELMGNTDLAIRQYHRVLEIKPDHKQAWLLLGALYEQQNKQEQALDSYQKSIAIDPSFAQGQLAVGVLYLNRKQPTEALPFIERAASLAPHEKLPQVYLQKVRNFND